MLFEDNEISINLTKNKENQYCKKYIDVHYHYIYELANKGELTIE